MIGKLPFIPGHEATGVITEVGKDVTDLTVGTRIAIENHFYCGDCYSCEVRVAFHFPLLNLECMYVHTFEIIVRFLSNSEKKGRHLQEHESGRTQNLIYDAI